jgi:hypothetical protein
VKCVPKWQMFGRTCVIAAGNPDDHADDFRYWQGGDVAYSCRCRGVASVLDHYFERHELRYRCCGERLSNC